MFGRVASGIFPGATDYDTPVDFGVTPGSTSTVFSGVVEVRWDHINQVFSFYKDGVFMGDAYGGIPFSGELGGFKFLTTSVNAEEESSGHATVASAIFSHLIFSQE